MRDRTNHRIGVDLGGTKIESIVVEGPPGAHEVIARKRVPTESWKGRTHITKAVAKLVQDLLEECHIGSPVPIGVGMPGSVTPQGLVKNSNTVCLNGTPFRQELSELLGQEVAFANDANCFALAEALMGAGRGFGVVFGIIMGTGVGGGLVTDGRIHEGPQSIAGEWGHMVLRPESDRVCYCSQPGCVETYLSGPGVEGHYKRISGKETKLPDIIKRGDAGEPEARQCVDIWLEHYGRAMANLVNVLDPDIVVLGGGLSNAECLYEQGRAQVSRFVFTDALLTPIVPNELGDSAGVHGAALLTAMGGENH